MQAFLDAANKATLLTTRWQDVLFGAQLVASNDIVGAVGAKKWGAGWLLSLFLGHHFD